MYTERQKLKITTFMNIALELRRLPTCDRAKVACIIVPSDFSQIFSIGYNGNYSGGPNKCDSKEVGNCLCTHAETNAIAKLNPYNHNDCILFSTLSPCINCAKLILNIGSIKTIIYHDKYRDLSGIELLKQHRKCYSYEEILST